MISGNAGMHRPVSASNMSHNTKTRNENIIRIQKFSAYGVLWAYTALKRLYQLVIVSVLHTRPTDSKSCKNSSFYLARPHQSQLNIFQVA